MFSLHHLPALPAHCSWEKELLGSSPSVGFRYCLVQPAFLFLWFLLSSFPSSRMGVVGGGKEQKWKFHREIFETRKRKGVMSGYSFLSHSWGRENEPAARWKEQGLEGKGRVFLCNQDEYVDLGPYSLWLLLLGAVTLRPGSSQQWKWVGMGKRRDSGSMCLKSAC